MMWHKPGLRAIKPARYVEMIFSHPKKGDERRRVFVDRQSPISVQQTETLVLEGWQQLSQRPAAFESFQRGEFPPWPEHDPKDAPQEGED